MSGSKPCTRLDDVASDDLAGVLDGTAAEEMLVHLASCDTCRDVRHEAEGAIAVVRRAADDYVPPSDLVDRLMASLDSREGPSPEATPTALEEAPRDAAAPIAESPRAAPKRSSSRRSWPRWRSVSLGFAAALAVTAVVLGVVRSRRPSNVASNPLRGQVVEIVRASKDTEGGLEVCASSGGPCRLAKSGEPVGEGSRLKTDPRTRARIALSDGSVIVLDRDTEIELAAGSARTARLVHGILAADVAHLEEPKAAHARFVLPHATVEVLGTKFTLTASSDMSLVEVSRGEVALHAGEDTRSVRAGSEGRVLAGRLPTVSPSAMGTESGDWAELAPKKDGKDDEPLRGIGELRAKKPGESRERGRAVRLARHHVDVRVSGNVARTEIDETFANDTADELEGIYRMPLPADAQIEKLALEVGGKLEVGAFVERTRAKAIWGGVIQQATPQAKHGLEDDIVWVPGPWRDPALLEWQRGGRFELRIFPIPAKGARRVVLAYTQTIHRSGAARRYTYPLAYDPSGAATIDDFSVDVQVMGHDAAFGVKPRGYPLARGEAADTRAERWSLHARAFVPAGDLAFEYALPNDDAELTVWTSAPEPKEGKAREDGYVALALRPKLPAYAESRERLHAVVLDASRSMFGERWRRASHVASTFVRDLDRRDRFIVLACDTECRALSLIAQAGGGSAADEVRRALSAIEPQGAHDPALAVRAAMERAKAAGSSDGKKLHVLYVGEGAATAGTSKPDRIAKLVAADAASREATVTSIAIGADADRDVLAALARGGGGAFLRDSGQSADALAVSALATIQGAVLRHPVVRLPPGLRATVPESIDSIPAGDETLVLARVEPGIEAVRGVIELDGDVGGEKFHQSFSVDVRMSSAAGNAFLPRLYASSRIGELERSKGEVAKDEIVRLSREHAVASRFTSLLVLESEAMFRAFGVERNTDVPTWTGDALAESVAVDVQTAVPAGDSSAYAFSLQNRPRASSFPGDPLSSDVPMRRIWVRRGSFAVAVPSPNEAAVTAAEAAWKGEPDNRSKLSTFVRALAGAGRIDPAAERVQAWLARDPLDRDALALRADLAARSGDRSEALRILGSAVDLLPEDASAQLRLARAFEAVGDVRACGHRVAVAEMGPKDVDNFVRAIRCARATGLGIVADDLLRGATGEIRRRLEAAPSAKLPKSEIEIDASWDGEVDLDVALVDAEGKRYAWISTPTGRTTVRDAVSTSRETLGLADIPPGTYALEIVRPTEITSPVRGTIDVNVFGKRTRVPFSLSGKRTVLGAVTVRREPQLVEASW